MIEYQRQHLYLYQDELARYLREKWDIDVYKFIICKVLKKAEVNHKKNQRISHNQSNELRVVQQTFTNQVKAEQLMFIDETLFKLQTMWRFMIYASIDDPARYHADIKWNDTINVLSAYIIAGYLFYIAIKKDYFNKEAILD